MAAAVVVLGTLVGCGGPEVSAAVASPPDNPPTAGIDQAPSAPSRAAATPTSVEQLGALVVTEVPSGLPRTPDFALRPPAGPKDAASVAAYADDPDREREVLDRYGFRYGWERFWGRGDEPVTSVFLDQFDDAAGARGFTEDLAHNDAEHYSATLYEHPPQLPDGCLLLTVDRAEPRVGLEGPTAFAECSAGVFSLAVTSVAGSMGAAVDEVSAVVRAELARLPAH